MKKKSLYQKVIIKSESYCIGLFVTLIIISLLSLIGFNITSLIEDKIKNINWTFPLINIFFSIIIPIIIYKILRKKREKHYINTDDYYSSVKLLLIKNKKVIDEGTEFWLEDISKAKIIHVMGNTTFFPRAIRNKWKLGMPIDISHSIPFTNKTSTNIIKKERISFRTLFKTTGNDLN